MAGLTDGEKVDEEGGGAARVEDGVDGAVDVLDEGVVEGGDGEAVADAHDDGDGVPGGGVRTRRGARGGRLTF